LNLHFWGLSGRIKRGQRTGETMRIFFAALAALFVCMLPASAAKRIALVIGNSNYDHVVDLRNPVNDADLMEKTLKQVGFEVTRLNDLDQRAMKTAMVEFGRKLKEGAEASMFYYAGHGVELSGVNYLVPIDADTRNKEEADIQNVSVNSFLALSENSNVPLNIVILDACRNNPFRGLRTTGEGGLAPVKAPRGTYVAYATAPGAVAADGEGANSPFTLALSESMMQPGLTLEGVLKMTRSKVQLATNGAQLPFDSSAITGDFYFMPKDVPQVATEPTPPAPVVQPDTAQQAYEAAGNDPDLLRVVVDRFGDTVWGALAREKLKKFSKPADAAPAEPPQAPKAEVKIQPEPEVEEPVSPSAPDAEATVQPDPEVEEKVSRPAPKKSTVKVPVREKAPVVRSKPERKKRATVEPRVAPKPKARPETKTRSRVIVEPKPRLKVSPEPKPTKTANLPFCGFSTVRAGSLCKDGNGRVCRVAFVFNGKGNRGPILRGCR
jgi:hypothetical protein